MSDLKAAKREILIDLDRVIVNMESVYQKTLTRDKIDEILWAMKILRVARKSINETLNEL